MKENGIAPPTREGKRSAAAAPDPEVIDKPLRRRFSPSYKLRIVEEAERCTEPGEVGQLLRGCTRDDMAQGGQEWVPDPLDEKVRKLERQNARLENELRKAHLIIDVQKVAGLLGISLDGDELLKAADELAKHVGVAGVRGPRGDRHCTVKLDRAAAAPPDARPGIEREGTRRSTTRCTLRGPSSGRWWRRCSTRTSTVLRTMYRGLRGGTPSAAESSRVHQTGVHGAEPGLVLGYYAATRAEEVELPIST